MEKYKENYSRYLDDQIVRFGSFEKDNEQWSGGLKQTIQKLFTNVPKEYSILDISCGDGTSIEYLRELGYVNITGVDISEKKINVAKERNPNNEFILQDIHDLSPLYGRKFDIIFSSHTLEHALYPVNVLLEFKKIMKYESNIFLIVPYPTGNSDGHPGADSLFLSDHDGAANFINLLKTNGYDVISYEITNIREDEIIVILKKKLNINITSYCYENCPNEVMEYQKKVFDNFDINITQVKGSYRHSEYMNSVMENIQSDIYIFFDIDCIPIKKGLIEYILNILNDYGMVGIEQQCNANESVNHIYAGPACFAITRDFYEKLGEPSFSENRRSDVAEELTHIAEERGLTFQLFKLKLCINERWNLGEDRMFGNGAIYDDFIYHEFTIMERIDEFITACKKILGE